MKQFLKELLSASDKTSSRRFTAMICLALLTTCVIAHLFGIAIDSNIIYALTGIITASLGMTMVNKPVG
jgi:hypothetical protein